MKYHNPWDIAYEMYKERYTKEQIDEMLFMEIQELIYNYNNYSNEDD